MSDAHNAPVLVPGARRCARGVGAQASPVRTAENQVDERPGRASERASLRIHRRIVRIPRPSIQTGLLARSSTGASGRCSNVEASGDDDTCDEEKHG